MQAARFAVQTIGPQIKERYLSNVISDLLFLVSHFTLFSGLSNQDDNQLLILNSSRQKWDGHLSQHPIASLPQPAGVV